MRNVQQVVLLRLYCALLGMGLLLSCGSEDSGGGGDDGGQAICETGSNTSVSFTASFTDLEDLDHIEPLGEIQIAHNFSSHTYVFIKPEVAEVPLYAPTDMDLVHVSFDGTDYHLTFKASCEVVLRFGHISNPITSIRNQVSSAGIPLFDNTTPSLLSFTAGDQLGTTSGTVQARSFDFGVYHSDRSQTFLNNDRFHPVEVFRYADCPYDYYTTDLRNQMYNLFGPKPLAEPLSCRGPRGVAGTLAGTWFDTVEVFSTPHHGQTEFSPLHVATSLNGNMKIVVGTETQVHRVFTTVPTYADPATVTTEHCYEPSSGGYFYFQLQADGTLRVARETSGSCPSEFPTATARTYYR